ncbi:kynureninase [Paucibacter sp. R3-3]|uniref:Kynureninase n=1 Tax=Roseateles agri TaxID=3098619 RepID=A0ABU5DM98_9BURK|nr:kynureninase [Paucibacter sp. R3-3]MDY0746866.1 kynureninase [Paucibacter sp. R3-3]
MKTRQDFEALDTADKLRALKKQFVLPPGVIYLDGNSLGAMPAATAERTRQVVEDEWGVGLIRSWNDANWIDLPARIGDKIARLVGAGKGEVIVADSTSLNLYKVMSAALEQVKAQSPDSQRRLIVSERENFPTDLYIAQSLAQQHGFTLKLIDSSDELPAVLDEQLAVLMLTQVNYRSGRVLDMQAITAQAHAAGVLVVWDLSHSAGAIPVDLLAANADFAVGCGYKYLNGGPGAPAFVWVNPRHADKCSQPLSGWLGHSAPFAFTTDYQPAPGIKRYICGTPSVISMAALECGVDTLLAAEPLGGMAALRQKSLDLTNAFITLVDERLAAEFGVRVASPRDPALRGSQVSLALAEEMDGDAYAAVQALIARGVIGDYRAGKPNLLRFGFTPLYLGFAEVWDAVEHLVQVLRGKEYLQPRFQKQGAVT